MIAGEQVKAARKLLGWSQMTLGLEAGTNQQTVVKFERGESRTEGRTISDIQRALETAGVAATPASSSRRRRGRSRPGI
jgi:transcriptional regulator with XRE-family HTH domain